MKKTLLTVAAAAVSVDSIRSIYLPIIPQSGRPTEDARVRLAMNLADGGELLVLSITTNRCLW